MPRFEVVRDSCSNERYEVWDSATEDVVAAWGSREDAEEDARKRNAEEPE